MSTPLGWDIVSPTEEEIAEGLRDGMPVLCIYLWKKEDGTVMRVRGCNVSDFKPKNSGKENVER
jgi:hypothetical protein